MTIALTGQDVHEAYNKMQIDNVRKHGYKYTPTTVNAWEDLSAKQKALYEGLALYLNEIGNAQEEVQS